jgi:hypothetical protein
VPDYEISTINDYRKMIRRSEDRQTVMQAKAHLTGKPFPGSTMGFGRGLGRGRGGDDETKLYVGG